ncbi:hypothetical protein [Leptospira johnsonii]|nr:hypothetical protein [Leptospira johnsonii]
MTYLKGSPLWMYFNGYSKKRIREIKKLSWEDKQKLAKLENDL